MIDRFLQPRRAIIGGLAAGMLVLATAPVHAENVNIPEGGAVTPGSTFVINFQVQEGCDGLPTDMIEVSIPEEVENPLPEDVPGWIVDLETDDGGDTQLVRWSGGTIDDDAFLEFGLRVGFPDDPGATIEFPVSQHCGDVIETSAPLVALQPRFGPQDILELSESVAALRDSIDEMDATLEALRQEDAAQANRDDRLGENISQLRDRVDALEGSN